MKLQERTMKRAGIGVLLATLFLLAVAIVWDANVYAEDVKTGVVNADVLNVRSGPGTSYSKVGKVYEGNQVTIIGEQDDTDGDLWYNIKYSEMEGWVYATYLDVKVVSVDFQKYLELQGFPKSYHAGLTALHVKYPNWQFEAQQTNLDWEEVIEAESVLGKSLVHTSSISSWKSVQTGAYDWTTGTWIGLDSSSWVAASSEIIAYYMDPRNFFDENYVFQFIKQSYDSTDTSYQTNLTSMVKNTFLSGSFVENGVTKTYVSAILDAAKSSKVSPYTLATMIIQEQGSDGSGGSISGTEPGYEGYYNYFNVGAYAVNGLTPVQKGLQYAKTSGAYGRPWDTRTKSISGGAQYFGEGYVQVGQDTIYLKKFNVQGENPYTHQYMTNIQGAASEGYILSKAYDSNARKLSLTFKIPVYKNMPSTACEKPTGDGSPNNMLQSLSVTGQSLTPTFNMYQSTYSLIVPNSVSSVTVSAKAYDSKATISGTGTKSLAVGTNTVTVTVKAQTGTTRTYTISIVREAAPTTVATPTLSSSSYKIDSSSKKITGITNFPVSASGFIQKLVVKNGSVKVTKADGTSQTGNVGTGTKVNLYNTAGKLVSTYTVVIYGDANGDGRINSQDLLTIQKNNIRISTLSGANSTAADVNRDGKINSVDLLLVQKHNIKIKSIEQ